MFTRTLWSLMLASALLTSALAFAAPECLDNQGQNLPIDDQQVLEWKQSTPNQTLERAHVAGTVLRLYGVQTGHQHFEIQIGPQRTDTLEVIYSMSFGEISNLQPGDQVEACGDYITSNAPAGQYNASPDGAIIHWVHRNPHGGHPNGFTIVNGSVYGGY